jgi:uncharacterized Zn finger protein (UPF0148 family)
MTSYVIVACSKCGRYLLAKSGQKTRTCPYCGCTVALNKTKKIASATTIREASKLLNELKSKASSKNKNPKGSWQF